ncbi:MAG: hypothetical protein AB7J40_03475 [Candidatus Altimarinota bacterium]
MKTKKDDGDFPASEAILSSVERELTPEQAREVLQFIEPKLVLTPVTSLERFREALASASETLEMSKSAYILEPVPTHFNAEAVQAQVQGNQIKRWRFAITEGAQVFMPQEWDSEMESFPQRIERFNRKFGAINIFPIDCQTYAALTYAGLLQGRPTDGQYGNNSRDAFCKSFVGQSTILTKGSDASTMLVAYWCFDYRQVVFYGSTLENLPERCRFRPAVIGDIVASAAS